MTWGQDWIAKQRLEDLPPHITVAFGRKALEKAVGKDTVKAALASTSYHGERANPRSNWWPYVYANDDGWVVACDTEDALDTQRGRNIGGYRAAFSWARKLAEGVRPFHHTHLERINTPHEWPVAHSEHLSIDLEGWGRIDRVGLSDGVRCGSFQWNAQSRDLTASLMDDASRIVAHNAPFDADLLRSDGLPNYPLKWSCTMTTHRILQPWAKAGLGFCAPLYLMLTPWKHTAQTDPESYNLMDVAVLPGIWRIQYDAIVAMNQTMLMGGETRSNFILHSLEGHRPCWKSAPLNRKNAYMANAVGQQQWESHTPHYVVIKDTVKAVAEGLIGSRITSSLSPSVTSLLLQGYGPQQIRKGCDDFQAHPDMAALRLKDVKQLIEDFEAANPALTVWRSDVQRLAVKERWVANPFGRRLVGLTGAEYQRALIWSTISDSLKSLLRNSPTSPAGLGSIGVYYYTQQDAKKAAKYANGENLWPIPLTWEVVK